MSYVPLFNSLCLRRAANRYEKIVFVTKVGREYDNTKAHPKNTNSRNPKKNKKTTTTKDRDIAKSLYTVQCMQHARAHDHGMDPHLRNVH